MHERPNVKAGYSNNPVLAGPNRHLDTYDSANWQPQENWSFFNHLIGSQVTVSDF